VKKLAGSLLFILIIQSLAFAQNAGETNLETLKTKIYLETPKLLIPNNNMSTTPKSPTLRWEKTDKATSYEVQISLDSTFKNIIFIPGEVLTNSCECEDLRGGTKYYWRVRGLNPISKSDWSTIWNFTTSILSTSMEFNPEIKKENLGNKINSIYSELAPVISPDGKTLYICRDNHPENIEAGAEVSEDIWYSKLDSSGKWGEVIHMGKPLNNSNPNCVCSVTPDGNTLLLMNIYDIDASNKKGCSLTHRTKDGWSFPEKVNIKNYYNNSRLSDFNLSNDGKTLLMSIQRNGSYGSRDLYVSFLKDGAAKEWSEPLNLGNTINTHSSDQAPFLASDGVTLYFSSAGHGGMGGLDIFVSRRLDDTWTNWTYPENLGPNINSVGSDIDFTIPASGKYVYFSSENNSFGKLDVFRLKLSEDIQPKPVVLIFGKILNKKTQQPIEAKVHYEILPQGNEIGLARSNPLDGEYKITLPTESKYGFRAEIEGFFPINDYIDASNINKYTEIERDLYLVPIDVGETIRINNIFFDFNKSDLKPESFPELKRIVQFLRENPKINIEIAGHTDDVGTQEYNQILSENRAKSVADYIVNNEIPADRIQYKGYGKTKPIADNSTEEGKQMNRRVEFVITQK
jgi:outer membrane protein OmpA-like peptidoglycan-associated protein